MINGIKGRTMLKITAAAKRKSTQLKSDLTKASEV
jgi:hypothetical protein